MTKSEKEIREKWSEIVRKHPTVIVDMGEWAIELVRWVEGGLRTANVALCRDCDKNPVMEGFDLCEECGI
jgi:hypothetical protein